MKGTMSHYWLSLTRGKTLIPVPTKGTMPGSFKRVFNYICFNPRTREGYDEIAGNDMDYISALIPVPMKGATSFITREIINDMF